MRDIFYIGDWVRWTTVTHPKKYMYGQVIGRGNAFSKGEWVVSTPQGNLVLHVSWMTRLTLEEAVWELLEEAIASKES